MFALTSGSVPLMANPTHGKAAGLVPTLQVLSVKPINNGERYRLVLSDGEHYVNGMLATQLNSLVGDGSLRDNAVVSVQEYMMNVVSDKVVIVVLRMHVVGVAESRIGAPIDVSKATGVPGAPATTAAPASNENASNYGAAGGYRQVTPATGGGAAPPVYNAYSRPASSSGHAPIQVVSPQAHGAAGGVHLTPIAGLNLYNNRWTIRARVTNKSDVKTWRNAKGEGSLFSVELLDDSNVDIRATLFREAVDKFYPLLEVGKIYRVSGGRLKVADPKWNTCKSSFEMTLDQNSEIHLDNDTGSIPQMHYEFKHKIAELERVDAAEGQHFDILAICKAVGDPVNLVSKKSGQELTKCDVTLTDDSNVDITLTLWGEKARNAPAAYANEPVLAIRRARVSDFNGKSLSADIIAVQPDLPEARQLQDWWQRVGRSSAPSARSLSSAGGMGGGRVESFENRKCVASIKEENLGYGNPDKPDWITFKATLTFLKKDKEGGAWYPACPNAGEPCKNRYKVTATTDGQWYCDKCQGSFPNCVRRWIFSGTVQDDTASTWVSFFNEQAEQLLGATADEVYQKCFTQGFDQDAYDSYFAKALFGEWIFKCKVKNEMVNDESRVKASVVSLVPVDHVKDSLDMLAAIEKF